MKKNIFLEKYKVKTKSELLEILNNREKYVANAIEAAEIILKDKYSEHSDIQRLEIKKQPIKEPTILKNETKNLKFYSQKAIGIATFIGGPLAAGYLIRENYLSLNKPDEGRISLIIGIISTILLFGGILMIPESIIDKVPNQILPAIYTVIILYIVAKIHGSILYQHKENGNEFYSGWQAAGIGLVSLMIIFSGIYAYDFFGPENAIYRKYDAELSLFQQNENETLVFYKNLESESRFSLIMELEKKVIPKWKENIQIIHKTNNIENLPSELIEQNKLLLKYSELRLKALELLQKALLENTDIYGAEIESINIEIEKTLKDLNP